MEKCVNPKADLVLFFDRQNEIAKERYLPRALAGRDDKKEDFARKFVEFVLLSPPLIEAHIAKCILLTIGVLKGHGFIERPLPR